MHNFLVFDNMCIQITLEKLMRLIYNSNMMKYIITIFTICALLFTGCEQNSYSASLTGMGTVISHKIYGKNAKEVFFELSEIIDELDSVCSLTKTDSEINRLNETGKTDNVHIITQARAFSELYLKTEGRLDITAGSITTLWNIGFENAKKPDDEGIKKALLSVDGSKPDFSDGCLTVGKGQKLDLGASAKGYALDIIKDALDKNNTEGAVITLGGSVLFYGKNPQGRAWRCAVKDPFDTNKYLGTFTLEDGFVSTSGSYERFFVENNVKYHHILDAKTGYPAETDVVSVTVVMDNGLLSDLLSTACFMLGSEKGETLLKEYNGRGIFVLKDGSVALVGDIDFEKA